MHTPVREDLIGRALESYAEMQQVLDLLTEEEVLRALELEHASARRFSVLSRLTARAAALYSKRLKEQYHG